MLVKAKWNVRDAAGWHRAGEIFETDADLGNSVDVLVQGAGKQEAPEVSVTESEPESEPEVKAEPAKEPQRPRAATRRKTSK